MNVTRWREPRQTPWCPEHRVRLASACLAVSKERAIVPGYELINHAWHYLLECFILLYLWTNNHVRVLEFFHSGYVVHRDLLLVPSFNVLVTGYLALPMKSLTCKGTNPHEQIGSFPCRRYWLYPTSLCSFGFWVRRKQRARFGFFWLDLFFLRENFFLLRLKIHHLIIIIILSSTPSTRKAKEYSTIIGMTKRENWEWGRKEGRGINYIKSVCKIVIRPYKCVHWVSTFSTFQVYCFSTKSISHHECC